MILQRSFPILSFCKLTSPKFLILPFNLSSPVSRFHHRPRSRIRAFSTAVTADVKETDTFFSDETVSWSSLGVVDRLSHALSTIGLNRPSLIQAECIPAIIYGNDVVVAAETGSGKTHAYLVPLYHKLLCTTENDSVDTDEISNRSRHMSLVLCPNVMLCDQVVRMANCICNDNGEPLLRVAAVCGRQGWPVNRPNIIVSTPAALLNYLHAIDPERRRRAEFVRDVKHVVFDEADMLLCGSFQNQVIRLINMFRFDEKVLSRSKNSPTEKLLDIDPESTTQFLLEDHEDMQDGEESKDEIDDGNSLVETQPLNMKKRDWRRTREIYERSKQYIFVAATLPENGKRTAGGELKRLFPEASWISGLYLHRHNPKLEQKWVEVTVDTQVDVLIDAVNQTKLSSSDSELSRTMVFANTVEAVEAIATVLQGAGIGCYCYHSESSLEERTRNLVEFQQKDGIFVCTDAAARGTDIPNVSHVIQAEFATSAVDFLHRVGRTARAGQPGLVTSMYNESNHDLVAAVRQAGKLYFGEAPKSRAKKTPSPVTALKEEDKNSFFVVRKGDLVGVYKSLIDCQAQVGSSVCDSPVSVFKGYSMPKESESYLLSRGLKNALYAIRAADLTDDLFGSLVPCPFQLPLVSIPEPVNILHEALGSQTGPACILEFDGACKGNPGQSGAGVVLRTPDGSVFCRLREGLGIATNNVAEYRAMILGLRYARSKGFTSISVVGDSKLVCMQIQGRWRVRHQNIIKWYEEAKQLKDEFLFFQINHVLRDKNADADAQANLAVVLADGQVQEEEVVETDKTESESQSHQTWAFSS